MLSLSFRVILMEMSISGEVKTQRTRATYGFKGDIHCTEKLSDYVILEQPLTFVILRLAELTPTLI